MLREGVNRWLANIKDLAKLAGVSVTAISQVLNNHPYVSKGKRAV
ncbi:hypothetical protein CON65_13410 [Bacillus pseudomycoides]|uniref:HTH lacI-type domain-containing protein n=1 Tax=Bacillus pseudomycoides TaxID=64104 RepID=A0AA91ZSX2_9BACI|nr:hypothetical protein COO03_02430 [Bacillus sp. AFS098217]PED82165.1 hypothetical protein CON65_13410 [Bacillus pseudomycoides]PEU10217.1 hypothetical protein CN524_16930 [Bacillus sp. AFS019443]PEU19109.1 hypothetical protein CN525_08750 [Bacillus sp. AFS014408]PFW64682.1 hypothetical protein COL20_03745 [Bacillus sp. AFS075034]